MGFKMLSKKGVLFRFYMLNIHGLGVSTIKLYYRAQKGRIQPDILPT